jgi:hypothetical protein
MTDIEKRMLQKLESLITNGDLSVEFLVKNIELCLEYSNGITAAEYARQNKKSYNGAVKETRDRIVRKIGGIPFCFSKNF